MMFTNKFKDIKKFYTIIFSLILFFNIFLSTNLYGITFNINEVEITENFDLNFNKQKVFDRAFVAAFEQLISTVITSKDKIKIEKTKLLQIKSLIDSFNVDDEKFIKDKYHAKINVKFNKKNTFKFFESQNIFPSSPKKLDLLIIPILIKQNQDYAVFFNDNKIYNNWNNQKEKFHLLNYILPSEDIENSELLKNKIKNIEEYEFTEIITKYDLQNYIIIILNEKKDGVNILSKLQFNNNYKIFNINYKNINFNSKESVDNLIYFLKTVYEDEWKKLNLINTSIKLPLTLSLLSKNIDKIDLFEKTINNLDLISSYQIQSFNSNNIFFKIIYNGPPDKFFTEIKTMGFKINRTGQTWKIK